MAFFMKMLVENNYYHWLFLLLSRILCLVYYRLLLFSIDILQNLDIYCLYPIGAVCKIFFEAYSKLCLGLTLRSYVDFMPTDPRKGSVSSGPKVFTKARILCM